MSRLLYLVLVAAPLGACAAPTPRPEALPAAGPSSITRAEAHEALFALFKASDEASLELDPLDALFRGDPRHADRFGDYVSDEYYAASRAAAERDLAALRAIDRA